MAAGIMAVLLSSRQHMPYLAVPMCALATGRPFMNMTSYMWMPSE